MKYVSRHELIDNSYRKVEALYRKGCSVTDIVRATELIDIEVLDVIQKIFAMDKKKEGLK